MFEKKYIIVCGKIFEEIKAAVGQMQYNNFEIFSLPKYNWETKFSELSKDIINHGKNPLLFFCNKCHPEKLAHFKAHFKDYNFHKLADCYELIVPKQLLRSKLKENNFIFISSNLDRYLKGKRLKKEIKRKIEAKGNIQKLIIFDTLVEPNLNSKAEQISQKLDIPYQIIPIGLDYLKLQLKHYFSKIKLKHQKSESFEKLIQASKISATYEMLFDLIQDLAEVKLEEKVVTKIFEIFRLLFSPKKVSFVAIEHGEISYRLSEPKNPKNSMNKSDQNKYPPIESFHDSYIWLTDSKGFYLKIVHNQKVMGYLKIQEIKFPKYIDRYLNIALIISKICGLAIYNARMYQKLISTKQQLERSNESLENFAYIVSHDLKQPLTTIIGYINLLKEINSGNIDVEPQVAMKEINKGSKYMNQMIDDLLIYSRVGRTDDHQEIINIKEVIEKIQENLYFLIEKANASIIYGELPLVKAFPTQMMQLFQNLIENAIKFRGDSDPIIEIRCEKLEHEWCFSVKDNGIGIKEEDFGKIFKIFRRSSSGEEVTGTGIGLSICKKIIETQGGEIWVESEEGKGSSFFFTLPCAN